jgi:hypothetical protein
MGFNYIDSKAKQHTKAWSNQFTAAANNLFALPANPVSRTFVAKGGAVQRLSEGTRVHVRRVGSALAIYQGLTEVAVAETPSLALYEMVDCGHGILEGTVSQVIPEAKLLLVNVVEGRLK